MKKIAIHRHSDKSENYAGKIQRVYFMPEDNTDQEIEDRVNEYNSSQDDYIVKVQSISDEIAEVIEYLSKNRSLDINRHLEVLKDIKSQLSDMDDYLYSAVREIKDNIEKQTKKE